MNVLSLFDGMSCGQIALERAGVKVDNYFASEIDKYAIKVTQHNYPNTIQLGDIIKIKSEALPTIDLLIGGSPCQDISNLNKFKKGLDGEKSGLFYQYYRLWKELNPLYFFLENVSGSTSAISKISKIMGVHPIRLNSNLVSAQNRKRLYWTNIPIMSLPQNNYIALSDILDLQVDDKYYQSEGWLRWWQENKQFQLKKKYSSLNAKIASCLTKRMYASWNGNFIKDDKGIRRLTPTECEKLQTVTIGYTSVVDDKFRYEILGNGWTVDVISHFFKHINGRTIKTRERSTEVRPQSIQQKLL